MLVGTGQTAGAERRNVCLYLSISRRALPGQPRSHNLYICVFLADGCTHPMPQFSVRTEHRQLREMSDIQKVVLIVNFLGAHLITAQVQQCRITAIYKVQPKQNMIFSGWCKHTNFKRWAEHKNKAPEALEWRTQFIGNNLFYNKSP